MRVALCRDLSLETNERKEQGVSSHSIRQTFRRYKAYKFLHCAQTPNYKINMDFLYLTIAYHNEYLNQTFIHYYLFIYLERGPPVGQGLLIH